MTVLVNSCYFISVADYSWELPEELLSLRLFVQISSHLFIIYIHWGIEKKSFWDIDINSQLWSMEYIWKMFRLMPFSILMLAAHFNWNFEKLKVLT